MYETIILFPLHLTGPFHHLTQLHLRRLDIVDDKKVRLHPNRALIRRVLQENKIRALEKKARMKLKGGKAADKP